MSPALPPLAPRWQAGLVLAFGALTAASIVFFASDELGSGDLLLFSASLGALATAALWLWTVAVRHRSRWGFALAVLLWVPYVNFVAASMFARRYWTRGARAPALLALCGMVGQAIATFHMLAPVLTAPV